jgi:putative ABC transport system substrate-binding protein
LLPFPRRYANPDAFFEGMRQYGFIDGQNLLDDPNGYGLRSEQFAGHAFEIVKQRVDLIVCAGDDAVRAAQQATKIIPILAGTDDMLGAGFVHSLAKPEGNITGHSILSFELNGKRQEILTDLLPAVRHMAALADAYVYPPERLQTLQELTRQRGVELLVYRVSKPEEIAGAIETAKNSGAQALNVLPSPFMFGHWRIGRERVAPLSLPTMYPFPSMAEEGGLIAYGTNIVQVWRDSMPRQAAALLRGAKVADRPHQRGAGGSLMRAFNGRNDGRDTSLQLARAPCRPESATGGRFLPGSGPWKEAVAVRFFPMKPPSTAIVTLGLYCYAF